MTIVLSVLLHTSGGLDRYRLSSGQYLPARVCHPNRMYILILIVFLNPGHPLLLDTVRRIYAKTVEAQHSLSHGAKVDAGENLGDTVSVLEWTGSFRSVSSVMLF